MDGHGRANHATQEPVAACQNAGVDVVIVIVVIDISSENITDVDTGGNFGVSLAGAALKCEETKRCRQLS